MRKLMKIGFVFFLLLICQVGGCAISSLTKNTTVETQYPKYEIYGATTYKGFPIWFDKWYYEVPSDQYFTKQFYF